MRNPAPVILILLLSVAALVLILRSPEKPEPEATVPVENQEVAVAKSEDETALPDPSISDDAVKPRAWPQETSDLPVDPKITFGHLPNGLRYIIEPNAEPPGRVSLRMHVDAGSLMETDDQQGIAHFLEHMLFNGSTNFTPDELIPRMQRLGIAFGAHVNAYTSFNETVYMLDLPDLSEETLDLGFTVMRDFGDGAKLLEEEIEKERGVILSEKTSRDSVDFRLLKQQLTALLPDSLISKRLPIGTEEVIRTAPRERFVDFYTKYYTPSRITFVISGDIEVEAMRERIVSTFGSMKNPDIPIDDPDIGTITPAEEFRSLVFVDKEFSGTDLSLSFVQPYDPPADTRANRIERLHLSLAHHIIGRRFDRIAKEENSPILEGSASRQDYFSKVTFAGIDISVAEQRWSDAVGILEREYRRALEYGFTNAELTEAKAVTLNAYEQAVRSKDTRQSDELAMRSIESIEEERVLTTPETNLEIAQEALAEVTAKQCHDAFSGLWKDKALSLILTTQAKPEDAEAELTALYDKSKLIELEAPKETENKAFAYTSFGDAGTVAEAKEIEDLDITRLQLSNGVTVNLKPTDFEQNLISLQARVGTGRLLQPDGKPGLAEFTTSIIDNSGVGEHSQEDLRQILAGRNVSFGFSVNEDHFSIAGSTTPEDLKLQLQAMTAQLLHPAYRKDAIDQFQKQVPMLFQQLRHTTSGPMQKMSSWIRDNDPRFSFPESAETFLAYTPDDASEWIKKEFTHGRVELNVVGDFDIETITPLILATFGAIPDRPDGADEADGLRAVTFPEAPAEKEYLFESKIPQGQAVVLWQVPGPRGAQQRFRRYNLVASIFRDRLREEIREKLGASYSPQAGVGGSTALDDFGYFMALNVGTPDGVSDLARICVDLAATFAKEGAVEDELNRARKPMISQYEKTLRDNSYWLGTVLSGSTDSPEQFELAKNRIDDVKSITLEEINQLAGEFLTADKAIQILIKPDAPKEEAPDSP